MASGSPMIGSGRWRRRKSDLEAQEMKSIIKLILLICGPVASSNALRMPTTPLPWKLKGGSRGESGMNLGGPGGSVERGSSERLD